MKPLGANDPTAVASYHLLGVLGAGGMGRVYLAESRTGRRVAIKVIHAHFGDDPAFRRRFEREVTAAKSVSPLYTAAVVDADTSATEPWLATTYIDGPSLSQLVTDEGPLAPGAVRTLAAGLAEALASIHDVGLVHRDVKPANVILDDSGPHIIDFGIVLTPDETRMTRSLILGTPSYVPPEVIQGEAAGPAGDVFALGATLVFAASGQHLVTDGPMHAQIMQIAAGRFDLSAVPKKLRPLIVRCTSANPRYRPTADELAKMLVASGIAKPASGWYSSLAPAAPIKLPRVRPRKLARRTLLLSGGALGLAAAGTGAASWTGVFAGDPASSWEPPVAGSPIRLPSLAPAGPGAIVWQARSGVSALGLSASARQSPARIIVERAGHLIAASGSRVFAVDIDGNDRWGRTLPAELVNLWSWGDTVLVSDSRRLWLLNALTGEQRFVVNAAEVEAQDSRRDNPDHLPVQINGVALSGDVAFVGLGTATVAFERSGRRLWRRARPNERNGARPPAGVPLATSGGWLVTHDPSGSVVDLGVRDVDNGQLRWLVQHEPAAPLRAGPPGGFPAAPADEAWTRSEGRIGSAHVVIREIQEVRVVSLANGATAWRHVSQRPVAGIELVGDKVLIADDRLRAHAVGTGAELWQVDLRGARVVVAPDGRSIVVASEQGLSALDLNGVMLWHKPYPDAVLGAVADRITAAGDLAFVTFRPRGEQREPLAIDVLAVALAGPR